MTERLQKILSARGVCSRRRAEEWIAAGRVTCNGVTARLGDSADGDTDVILLDGKPLPAPSGAVYIMLHKPRGYVTTLSDEKGRPNAAQLVSGCGRRVYPVGRLDMDSEGLLLFTNDGQFANALAHPSHRVDKVYDVTVRDFSAEGLRRLQEPVTLDGYRIQPPRVELCRRGEGNCAQLRITIHEGRNRQVRRMCALAEMEVIRLVRVAEGPVRLGDLQPGKWRYLKSQEVAALKK